MSVHDARQAIRAAKLRSTGKKEEQAKAERVRGLVQEKTPEAAAALQQELDAVRQPAAGLAWFAFWDILVFFGVLLVGFAYLWRRGDIDWVRSTAAERLADRTTEAPSLRPEDEALIEHASGSQASRPVAAGH